MQPLPNEDILNMSVCGTQIAQSLSLGALPSYVTLDRGGRGIVIVFAFLRLLVTASDMPLILSFESFTLP